MNLMNASTSEQPHRASLLARIFTFAFLLCTFSRVGLADTAVYTYMDLTGSASGNGAYVNTGYLPKYNSIIRAKFQVTDNSNKTLYCSRYSTSESASNKHFSYNPSVDSKIRYDYHDKFYAGTVNINTTAYPYNSDLTLEVKDGVSKLTLDATGAVIDGLIGPGELKKLFAASTYPLVLFSSYTMSGSNPSSFATCFHGRFYYLQVFKPGMNGNEILLHEYRPCVEDGTAKIVDMVTGATYAINKVGTGAWTVSGEIYSPTAIAYTDSGDYVGRAEGLPHSITVTPFYPTAGVTVEYSTDQENWSATAPSFTEIGTYTVYFRLSAEGFVTASGSHQIVLSAPVTCTWTGAGADNYASTAANWSGSALPISGDAVVFDATSAKDVTWDAVMAEVKPGSWTQTAGYTNTVTFETTYDENILPKVEVSGDVTLNGGKWTHTKNYDSGNAAATKLRRAYRLYVTVGGSMTIGPSAVIDVLGCGYYAQYMAAGGTGPNMFAGGSYGGRGGNNDGVYICHPYGKYYAPEEPGSGMNGSIAGGAVRLDITGALTNNGSITASSTPVSYYTGSGGSIYINAGSISGTGTLAANSDESGRSKGWSTGSGGRIAVILHDTGADFSNYDIAARASAYSGTISDTNMGAPGTIYAETAADIPQQGWLIVKDNGGTHVASGVLRPDNYSEIFAYGEADTLSYSKISLLGGAVLRLPTGKTLDLRNKVVEMADKTKNGYYLAGGSLLVNETAASLDCYVGSEAGFSGVQTETLTFAAPASVMIWRSAGTPFPGNIVFGDGISGVTATMTAPLAVAGDLTLKANSSLTVPAASATPLTLTVNVGGDLTIEDGGKIDMKAKGYTKSTAPQGVRAILSAEATNGASHGGRGAQGINHVGISLQFPYGSVVNPLLAGAAGTYVAGGGIIVLDVAGSLINNGSIDADAALSGYYGSAGGSVKITAGTLSGVGRISADGSRSSYSAYDPCGAASGGRVAVTLTGANSTFATYSGEISAYGGYANTQGPVAGHYMGSAGTVYLRTTAQDVSQGTLIVDNPTAGMLGYYETPVGGAIEGDAFGDVLIGRSVRFLIYADSKISVSGCLSNGCEFVAEEGSTVDLIGSGISKLYGDMTFANLTSSADGKVIEVEAGSTITVAGVLSLIGATDSKITLRSSVPGIQFNLVPSGGTVLSDVILTDCNSSAALTVVNGDDGGNNSANVSFVTVTPGETVTWSGAASAAWHDAANWSGGRAPAPTDNVVIPANASHPPAFQFDVTLASLTVNAGASLDLAGKVLTLTGDLTVAGTIDADDATLVLNGTAKQTVNANGAKFRLIRAENSAIDFVSAIAAGGAFIAEPSGAPQALSFARGATFAFNTFTVNGDASATNVTLKSTEDGAAWYLKANAAEVTGAAVKDSDATQGVLIVTAASTDNGGNAGWLFVDNRTYWTGAKNTDFADAENWSDGAPTAAKGAVIAGAATVNVSSAAEVGELTLYDGAKLTIRAAFAVHGSLTIGNGGEVAWDVPGTVHGNLTILDGGVLAHTIQGSTASTEQYWLDLAVGGDGYIAEGGAVNVMGKGYAKNKGPGAPNSNNGAAYGGRATDNGTIAAYGSYLCPTNCGSGGYYSFGTFAGGGIAKLLFGGTLTLDGEIDADGLQNNGATYYTSAGGSIWIEAKALFGKGDIHANGSDGVGSGYRYGSGGRIAVKLSETASFDGYTGAITAYGGRHGPSGAYRINSTCGTVYLETAADGKGRGTVYARNARGEVDSASGNYTNHNWVDLPSTRFCDPKETRHARFVVDGYTTLYLTSDTRIQDLNILDSNSKLMLNGYKLYIHSYQHAISPNDATQIDYGNGGEIEWYKPGTLLMLR